ncbi:MAG: hypothetical protein AAGF49_11970, partial [Pseudomonadota bacterium]
MTHVVPTTAPGKSATTPSPPAAVPGFDAALAQVARTGKQATHPLAEPATANTLPEADAPPTYPQSPDPNGEGRGQASLNTAPSPLPTTRDNLLTDNVLSPSPRTNTPLAADRPTPPDVPKASAPLHTVTISRPSSNLSGGPGETAHPTNVPHNRAAQSVPLPPEEARNQAQPATPGTATPTGAIDLADGPTSA